MLLGTGMLWAQYEASRTRAEAQLVEQARVVALLVDQEFSRAEAAAVALASSSSLARGDLVAFDGKLRATRDRLSAARPGGESDKIAFFDAEGRRRVYTGWPAGAVRIGGHGLPYVDAALTTGRSQSSDLIDIPEAGPPCAAVAVPVFDAEPDADGKHGVMGVIAVTVARERLLDVVLGAGLPAGAFASVQDRAGRTVARSFHDAETLGKLPMPSVLAAISSAEAGLVPRGTRTLEGVASTIAFARAPHSGYIVKLDVPETVFLAPFWSSLRWAAGLWASVLAVGLALAFLQARRIVAAFHLVPRAALNNGQGPASTGLREADDLAASLSAAFAEREQAAASIHAITNAMPQMVWSTKPDGCTDYMNERWYSMTSMTPEQTHGADWTALIHPEDRDRFGTSWRHALATGEPYELEHRLLMADGKHRWVLGRALPIRHDDGQVIRWFGTCTDIEEIVEAREVLTRDRAAMEGLIAARTHDLHQAQERLVHVRRMEALGQLAGGIAHDFNNVLQAVQGGTALIERRSTDADGVRRLARMVLEAAARGASVTRRLLAFSRRGDLRTEAVDPESLLAGMHEVLIHTLGTGVGVRVAAGPALPMLLADKGQLETVLINLSTNARDAMDGHGTLTLAADLWHHVEGSTLLPNLKSGAYVRLSVTDTGMGMTPHVLARVTEPFFTTKEQGKGTGLGLAMARGFAEQSGGALHIESTPGQGTTVSLWFPLAEGAPAAVATSPVNGRSAERRRARVLIVDDDAIVREVTAEGMEAEGYAVLSAVDGQAALDLLDKGETVDAMICDLSMPGLDGLALTREVQRRRSGLPAILLTGFATNAAEIAVGGAVSGTFTLLRKPITANHLAERLEMLLEPAGATVP